jgi:hypothetical protein
MNEFRGGELETVVGKLIVERGMENMLKAILKHLQPMEIYNEDYINLLIVNLKKTLKDYEGRHDSK